MACGGVHHVGGKLAALVDRRRARRDNLARELLDCGLEGALIGGEIEVHGGGVSAFNTKDTKGTKVRPYRLTPSAQPVGLFLCVLCVLCVQGSSVASRSKIGLNLFAVVPRSSGSTRTLPTTVMKFVS